MAPQKAQIVAGIRKIWTKILRVILWMPYAPKTTQTGNKGDSVRTRERFTIRAKRVLMIAEKEAHRTQHKFLTPEHVLLALSKSDGSIAQQVLINLRIDQNQLEKLINPLGDVAAEAINTEIELHPLTKKVLELAVDEARRMGNPFIGTEHLLLGLIRQGDSATIDILKQSGASPEIVRRETIQILRHSPASTLEGYWLRQANTQSKILQMVQSGEITKAIGDELLDTLHAETSDLSIALDIAVPQLRQKVRQMTGRQVVYQTFGAGEIKSEAKMPLDDLWAISQWLIDLLNEEEIIKLSIGENTMVEISIEKPQESNTG